MITMTDIPNSFSRLWVDPRLVGPDGRANPEYLTVPTTPGEQGQLLFLRGKNTWNLDMSLLKTATIHGNKQITFHFTMTNVFNAQVWSTVGFLGDSNITSQTFGQTANPINTAATGLFARGVQVLGDDTGRAETTEKELESTEKSKAQAAGAVPEARSGPPHAAAPRRPRPGGGGAPRL